MKSTWSFLFHMCFASGYFISEKLRKRISITILKLWSLKAVVGIHTETENPENSNMMTETITNYKNVW